MRNLRKVICLLLVLALVIPAAVLTVSADDPTPTPGSVL